MKPTGSFFLLQVKLTRICMGLQFYHLCVAAPIENLWDRQYKMILNSTSFLDDFSIQIAFFKIQLLTFKQYSSNRMKILHFAEFYDTWLQWGNAMDQTVESF